MDNEKVKRAKILVSRHKLTEPWHYPSIRPGLLPGPWLGDGTMNRPMPKSYLTEAEREELRAEGFSDNVIFIKESAAARAAGDFDTGWDWLALADLPDYSLLCLKKWYGAQFIRDKGFKTGPAEKRYGKDWLERDIPYGE